MTSLSQAASLVSGQRNAAHDAGLVEINLANDTQRTTGMLQSPRSPCRYLETNIHQHLVMNYGWRWNACSRPVSLRGMLFTISQKYASHHGCWDLRHDTCGIVCRCTVMDYSEAIKHITRADMSWQNIPSHILIFTELDHGLIKLFPLM